MIGNGKRLFTNLLAILVVMLVTMITPPAQASPADNLNLSDQQKSAIQAIYREANDQVNQLTSQLKSQGSRGPRAIFSAGQMKQKAQDLFKKVETIRTDAIGKIRSQLNPAQQESYNQLVARVQGVVNDEAALMQNLNLNNKQKMQLTAIRGKATTQSWDILGNESLSSEQKIEQLKKTSQDSVNNIRTKVLSSDQQTKFDVWQQQPKISVFELLNKENVVLSGICYQQPLPMFLVTE